MTTLNVQWYEGLFLRPQHFQAAERCWSDQLHRSQRWDHPYHYGIRHIDINEEALRNHKFELESLQVRMGDGTLVNIRGGNEPDRLDLKTALQVSQNVSANLQEALEQEATTRVYLAVPK